ARGLPAPGGALPRGQAPAGRPHHPPLLDRRGERGLRGSCRGRGRPRPDRLLRAAMLHSTPRPTPMTVYLPFNRDCLRHEFVPAKTGAAPPDPRGHWLLVQDQALLVVPDGHSFRLPEGERPSVDGGAGEPIWLGTLGGTPCWGSAVPKDAAAPPRLARESMVPMQGTRLPDELLSLGGMAMQLLWWESTSGHCPRCGEPTARIPAEWGKQCPRCRYEHYPHLHPAVITLVRDGDRVLLARK